YLKIRCGAISFWRIQLFRNAPGWRYEGTVHEYLTRSEIFTHERLQELLVDTHTDGARAAQTGVYQRDVGQLLRTHQQSPDDPRTIFYLAQSYSVSGEPALALEYYERYVAIGGWPEEVWLAKLQIAAMKQELKREWPEVLAAYLDAYQFRPNHAEP